MNIAQHIGTRIRAARAKAGLSQKELAQRVGIGQPMISRIEKGDRVPSTAQLTHIAAALGVPTSDLMPSTDNVADDQANYRVAIRAVLSDYDSPHGLRELVTDNELLQTLNVSDEEISILSAIPVDGISKDGYVQLLITLRAVRP